MVYRQFRVCKVSMLRRVCRVFTRCVGCIGSV